MAHVYILKSRKSGQFYIGSTIELQRRIAEHTNGKVKSTKGFRPLELVFSQEYATAAEAKSIEYKLKQLKSRDAIKKIIKDGYIKTTGCGAAPTLWSGLRPPKERRRWNYLNNVRIRIYTAIK